jgi:complement component 1 Q subcomponent-binding protein
MASDVAAGLHTKVDKDLVTFLDGEVEAEKQQHQPPKAGPGIPGFEVKAQKARIMLTKKFKDETITIKFNINGTVGTEEEDLDDAGEQQGENPDPNILAGDMKSRPDFVVEIAKPNGRILAFTCRLYSPSEIPPDQPDADRYEIEGFGVLNAEDIDEDGDWAVDTYVGDGGIIDGQMYDLLMNYLDSRGLGNEFVDHLVDFTTYYEHNQYINLLDNLKSFLSGK